MPADEKRNYGLWLGPLLGLLGLVGYFGFVIQVGWRDMSDFPWLNLLFVAAGIALSVVAAARVWRASPAPTLKRVFSVLGLGFSGFSAFALVGYVFSMSYGVPDEALAMPTGEALPVVSLTDNRGQPFELGDATSGDTVLVFYRGFW